MYGQYENRYPDNQWQENIGNSDLKLNFSATDTETAQYFCDLLGVATAETTSIRRSNSIEGDLGEFGQKNISTLKRNLLNRDEIIRLPSDELIGILSHNKPLLLKKMIYTEHPLSKKLKDSPISDYNPKWARNMSNRVLAEEKKSKKVVKKEKISWENF